MALLRTKTLNTFPSNLTNRSPLVVPCPSDPTLMFRPPWNEPRINSLSLSVTLHRRTSKHLYYFADEIGETDWDSSALTKSDGSHPCLSDWLSIYLSSSVWPGDQGVGSGGNVDEWVSSTCRQHREQGSNRRGLFWFIATIRNLLSNLHNWRHYFSCHQLNHLVIIFLVFLLMVVCNRLGLVRFRMEREW